MKHNKKIIAAMLLTMGASSAQAMVGTIDFETQETMLSNSPVTSLAIGDVTFDSIQGGGFTITDLDITNVGTTELDYSGQYLLNGALGFSSLKVSFSNPVSQFSFNLGDNQLDWELEAFNTEDTSIASLIIDAIPTKGTNNGDLFGLSSLNEPSISYATLTQVGATPFGVDTIEFDNLTYTAGKTVTSPIPEPSTYALMLGGLGLIGFMAHRRRKTTNA